ncbi:hypothetical protein [Flavobacterium microcysteis]|uniref:Uncharacterized protein n=1 Tax=Flavobacterium microcysteis TaxID=2596891 RepID=A0A501QEF2_9FLAO|nr:hypothetical protein [Flavobacterium microcysteis]TPD70497.1 hypothetical protein FJA49_06055 [Flavobacterium microcysteis]
MMDIEFNKQVIRSCIVSILNVSSLNALDLMRDLDKRVLSGKTNLADCSFQVCNAYEIYIKFISLIDAEYAENRILSPLNPHGLNVVNYG